jgi:hypothetical protein
VSERKGKEVTAMTGIGWEFWGLKFSWLLVAVMSVVLLAYTWIRSHGVTNMTKARVDSMAGDEGED